MTSRILPYAATIMSPAVMVPMAARRPLGPLCLSSSGVLLRRPEEAAEIPQAPTQLAAVIDRPEEDGEYLTEGGVFTPDLTGTWISYKRDYEIAPVNPRPTPYEFALYYDG